MNIDSMLHYLRNADRDIAGVVLHDALSEAVRVVEARIRQHPTRTPENVECPDCQGRGWHTERQGRMSGQFTCLGCDGTGRLTPENVECRTCGGCRYDRALAPCPDCPTPENVDSPDGS